MNISWVQSIICYFKVHPAHTRRKGANGCVWSVTDSSEPVFAFQKGHLLGRSRCVVEAGEQQIFILQDNKSFTILLSPLVLCIILSGVRWRIRGEAKEDPVDWLAVPPLCLVGATQSIVSVMG